MLLIDIHIGINCIIMTISVHVPIFMGLFIKRNNDKGIVNFYILVSKVIIFFNKLVRVCTMYKWIQDSLSVQYKYVTFLEAYKIQSLPNKEFN